MNSFVNGIGAKNTVKNTTTLVYKTGMETTTNGAPTYKSTLSHTLDLFARIGSARGVDLRKQFDDAYLEDESIMIRMLLWLRDVRHGSGERKTFRDLILHMEANPMYHAALESIIPHIPEYGRWDDILIFKTRKFKEIAYRVYANALQNNNALAAKWAPREKSSKRQIAVELMRFMNLDPKKYRKLLVQATQCVETQMCAKQWDKINFNHVPSIASSRYMKAFGRNTTKYSEYISALKTGGAKINASAIFPHDVLMPFFQSISSDQLDVIEAQWAALPNYMNGKRILPVIDTSSSMTQSVPGTRYTHMHIAISLGMYMAEKNTGAFRNVFVTFNTTPTLNTIVGKTIYERYNNVRGANWGGSTNLAKSFDLILDHAKKNNVPENEMPELVIIPSDMQFDCADHNKPNFESIKKKFESAGYKMPRLVFWQMNGSHSNNQVREDEANVSLISGFSPSILKAVLSDSEEETKTPYEVMLETLMNDRYNIFN